VIPIDTSKLVEYTDEQVLVALKSGTQPKDHLLLKHFFSEVHAYAFGCWQKKYARLSKEDWAVVFSNSDWKLVSRLKNELVLKEQTTLKTYYTGIVDYAVLDFLAEKKKTKVLDIPQHTYIVAHQHHFEKEELAENIRKMLVDIVGNKEQVKVLLLQAKGYSYEDIVQETTYISNGACRNACLKGKKKLTAYILKYPAEGKRLRKLLMEMND